MDNNITQPVVKELEKMRQYLATQSADVQVSVDSPIPDDRYLIPNSLILIIQYAQRYNSYPLSIHIRFLKHTVEINYARRPRTTPNESFADIEALASLYRNYFNVPQLQQTDKEVTVTIPLFI